jgi:hypothetical protein
VRARGETAGTPPAAGGRDNQWLDLGQGSSTSPGLWPKGGAGALLRLDEFQPQLL